MLDKEISKVFDSITNQWDKNTVQIGIKETLLTKRKRVSNEGEYFNALCENIVYLSESSHSIKKVLESCFQKNFLWETADAESYIVNAQKIIREEMQTLLVPYKDKLTKNTLLDSIEQAELSYAYSKLKYDMEMDFLFAFLHSDNRTTMETFLKFDSSQFFPTFDRVSDGYANFFIQSIEEFIGHKNPEDKQHLTATPETPKKGWIALLFGK